MHLRKRMTFHGVEYLIVPVELWEEAKSNLKDAERLCAEPFGETIDNMTAYEGSNEPEELNDE